MPQQQAFGRRGHPAASGAPRLVPEKPVTSLAPDVPPEVIAAVLNGRSSLRATAQAPGRPQVHRVGWSFRAAVLAGLIVGLFNAAARATTFLSFGSLGAFGQLSLFGGLSLNQANVPISLLAATAGLWSGARASAWTLLFTHKILARLGHTSLTAYGLGGAAACLVYAFGAALFGADTTLYSVLLEGLSGLGAGFFYRLFAVTERS
jgi:hypothetical protein